MENYLPVDNFAPHEHFQINVYAGITTLTEVSYSTFNGLKNKIIKDCSNTVAFQNLSDTFNAHGVKVLNLCSFHFLKSCVI